MKRYEVRTVQGPARGDLFELEQTTYFHVVDLLEDKIILTFREDMEASLSKDNGLWTDYHYSGVCEVVISADEQTALVNYHDGNQKFFSIPAISETSHPTKFMTDQNKKNTKSSDELTPKPKDIQEMVSFLPRLYQDGFKPIKKWEGGILQNDGSYNTPYPRYRPEVIAFYKIAMKSIWMDHNYNPDKAWKMLLDHEFVANASLAQIKTMITLCVRGERFMDGHWAMMIEHGHIRRLLERLAILNSAHVNT